MHFQQCRLQTETHKTTIDSLLYYTVGARAVTGNLGALNQSVSRQVPMLMNDPSRERERERERLLTALKSQQNCVPGFCAKRQDLRQNLLSTLVAGQVSVSRLSKGRPMPTKGRPMPTYDFSRPICYIISPLKAHPSTSVQRPPKGLDIV